MTEPSRDDLDESLDEWTSLGIIRRDQAEAIARHARGSSFTRTSTGSDDTVTYELVGLAAAGLVVLLQLILLIVTDSAWSQAVITLVAGVALAVAGAFLQPERSPAYSRLQGALWFVATLELLLLVLLIAGGFDLGRGTAWLLAGLVSTPVAIGLWAYRARRWQVVGMLVTLSIVVVGATSFASDDRITGLALWALGGAWLAVVLAGWIEPKATAARWGAGLVFLGVLLAAADGPTWLLVGLATSVAMVASGRYFGNGELVAWGWGGVVGFGSILAYQLVSQAFSGVSFVLVLLTLGACAVLLAVTHAATGVEGEIEPEDQADQPANESSIKRTSGPSGSRIGHVQPSAT